MHKKTKLEYRFRREFENENITQLDILSFSKTTEYGR